MFAVMSTRSPKAIALAGAVVDTVKVNLKYSKRHTRTVHHPKNLLSLCITMFCTRLPSQGTALSLYTIVCQYCVSDHRVGSYHGPRRDPLWRPRTPAV